MTTDTHRGHGVRNPVRTLACKWLAGLLATTALSAGAMAQQKTLYVGMNGGDMERAFTQHVFPAFEKANNVKIVVVPGTSTEVLAKAQAFKDKPQMHVMFLDDGVMSRAISMGLCEKIQDGAVLRQLYPAAVMKDGMAAGIDTGMTGLGYNTHIFKDKGWAPPTSWMDLADPKYKGKVVFQSAASSTFGLHAFLMFNRIQGGKDQNVEPGFGKWSSTIGPNVLEYITNSAKLAEMIQSDEAAIFPLTPTAIARLKKRGIPVEYAQPKEGSVILVVGECVVAKNSEPELSQKLAAYLLSREAQEAALEYGGHFPSNRDVKGTGDNVAVLKQFQDYMANAKVLDWDAINATRPAFNARWNRVMER
ncbi:spermidine/putrescine ABC transporter substrate-binding protein [Achromobacter aloeverae]|uniref:Spermidine/putrescine ABC transporter substrate-binding protein n=2 Tax=Achromobacter aloeverae TaxID=1750518 RepID=A0A4Q1HKP6_9BURK|nr:ABC transporter substrate-binding protein [Achromobacter aloeverae]RXN88216.1 spermidine/putrescine ABC transporter substrate-binding protein [Achromobacter aloeverae]